LHCLSFFWSLQCLSFFWSLHCLSFFWSCRTYPRSFVTQKSRVTSYISNLTTFFWSNVNFS
jgi:hypothetical protein